MTCGIQFWMCAKSSNVKLLRFQTKNPQYDHRRSLVYVSNNMYTTIIIQDHSTDIGAAFLTIQVH